MLTCPATSTSGKMGSESPIIIHGPLLYMVLYNTWSIIMYGSMVINGSIIHGSVIIHWSIIMHGSPL
jgi:hypothetical protein